MKYEIIVGNIGTITSETQEEAQKTYAEYVQQSRSGYGRAAGEQVILLVDGVIANTNDDE